MRKMFLMCLGIWLASSACAPRATPEGYRLMMNTWINHSTDELLTKWGAPTSVIPLSNGDKLFEYVKAWQNITSPSTYVLPVTSFDSGTVTVGNQFGSYNSTNTQYVPVTSPGSVENFSCTTRFKVSPKGLITEATWVGNGCVSEYRPPPGSDAVSHSSEGASTKNNVSVHSPARIRIGKSPVLGPASAKVTIVFFGDYECQYSKRGEGTMNELRAMYPSDIRLVFKHFPLPFHKEATLAARASYAAGQQGKFWEYHTSLFRDQDQLGQGKAFLLRLALQLGLNISKFEKDMNSSAAIKQVEADMAQGAEFGVKGTPAFFVNGILVAGAYPLPHFKKIIEQLN